MPIEKTISVPHYSVNRLTRENNQAVGKAWGWTYDNGGNLLTFSNGTNSHTYTYGDSAWGDLLTAVDGQAITYDKVGHPLTFYDGYHYTLTWEEGRQLESVTYNNQTTSYQYDYNGIRTRKTNADGSYIIYDIVDGTAVGETRYTSTGAVTLYMRYIFDEGNSVIGISLWYANSSGWTDYYFAKNLQGDVLEVYQAKTHTLVAEYMYDAWGNILWKSGSLSDLNPFRYRSYYYDNETWFYYLQSRYYDPAIGRFINADAYTSTGQGLLGNNMFTYCLNNPVNKRDFLGYISYDAYDEDPNGDRNPLNDVAKIGTGSISRGTFRIRLVKLTGQTPPNSDAHHIFPYSMASKFSQLGIDVNNAQYGSWVDSSTHRQYSYDYNQWWVEFFNIPGVTQGDAFALVEFLAALFGFDLNY